MNIVQQENIRQLEHLLAQIVQQVNIQQQKEQQHVLNVLLENHVQLDQRQHQHVQIVKLVNILHQVELVKIVQQVNIQQLEHPHVLIVQRVNIQQQKELQRVPNVSQENHVPQDQMRQVIVSIVKPDNIQILEELVKIVQQVNIQQ